MDLPSKSMASRRGFTAQEAFTRFFTPAQRSPTEAEQMILKEARQYRISSRPANLATFSWGKGPAVLLIHGWSGCGAQLTPFVSPLVAAGFQVIACDLPAHGQTLGTQTSGFEFAEAIQAIATQVGEVIGIIGHSWGAAGTVMALDEGVEAQRVVCLGSPCWLSSSVQAIAKLLRLSPLTEARLRELIEHRYGKEVWDRASMNLRARHLKSQGLLFHDRNDRKVSPNESEAIATAWPQAELVLTSGLGHERILQDTTVIEQTVKFMQGAIA
jgi:pimeloyl-ACP methyl ester carboxylesterase